MRNVPELQEDPILASGGGGRGGKRAANEQQSVSATYRSKEWPPLTKPMDLTDLMCES